MQNLAIYIHWPYCRSKCPYCDFNSHVANAIDHAAWREAYRKELNYYAQQLPDRLVTSIFFGGGTPSLMEVSTVEAVLGQISASWCVSDNVEITLEANPNSVEAQKFADLRKAGVNRLSLGVQSLNDNALKFLGRGHNSEEARKAIELAARNFTRFSFDLIYARKDQKVEEWKKELCEALALVGEHLSLYQLTIEPNTQFHTRDARGEKLTVPTDDAAHMYELTQDILAEAGLPAYEISNYAKPGAESRHNLAYWHYDDYIGIGPGAHGRYQLNGKRYATETHRAPDVWILQVKDKNNGVRVQNEMDADTAQREALMMGLRLTEGIAHDVWERKFRRPLAGGSNSFIAEHKIKRLEEEGYLQKDAHSFKATKAGLQRLDAILGYLLN